MRNRDDFDLTKACNHLLQAIEDDPGARQGLIDTPRRFAEAWKEWTRGYNQDPKDILKTFEDGAANYDEFVIVKDIPAYSKCEHHLADIFGVAHIGYIPNGKIVGLSKLNRLVECFGRRLQVQERWTTQIADAIDKILKPRAVAVVLECRHMCIESRGISHQGSVTLTSALRGAVTEEAAARAEFFRLIGK